MQQADCHSIQTGSWKNSVCTICTRRCFAALFMAIFLLLQFVTAQSPFGDYPFIPLYPAQSISNSKGAAAKDSVSNERAYRVATPGIIPFFTSSAENKGAAVLICPGGGYARLAYVISGTQLAKWFNTIGINAFVLISRLPNAPGLTRREEVPLQDAQRAMRIIRASASKWGIQPDRIGVQGSSAGGHLAAMLSCMSKEVLVMNDSLDRVACRPNFMMLVSPVVDMGPYAHTGSRANLLGTNPSTEMISAYSVQNLVSPDDAPAFIVHAQNDPTVSPVNSLLLYRALIDNKVSASLHIFPQGAHSIALRNNPGSAEHWTELAEAWLKEMEFIQTQKSSLAP